MNTLMQSEVPGATLFRRGKVRDVYEAGGDRLVIVASDRLSAFDVVLPTPIPDKGRVLNELSSFWFDRTERVVPNHLVSTNIDDMPAVFREVPEIDGRAVLVKRCERIDVECVARGYISGSAWTEYKALGTVASEALPKDLQESQRLDEPMFTPATKAESGHDVNISRAQLSSMVGSELAKQLEEVTLELYSKAHAYALGRGLILADTKFEFGTDRETGIATLADEVLTSDSSRYWDLEAYLTGVTPDVRLASFDKQIVRDWLAANWNQAEVEDPPTLPSEIVEQTAERYRALVERLTQGL